MGKPRLAPLLPPAQARETRQAASEEEQRGGFGNEDKLNLRRAAT